MCSMLEIVLSGAIIAVSGAWCYVVLKLAEYISVKNKTEKGDSER